MAEKSKTKSHVVQELGEYGSRKERSGAEEDRRRDVKLQYWAFRGILSIATSLKVDYVFICQQKVKIKLVFCFLFYLIVLLFLIL